MATASPWFDVHRVDDATFVIDEPGHVRSHLIIGADRAVLFDTGLGVAPIRPVVEELTDVGVLVMNSHHHMDHVGGNHEFDDVVIHKLGADLLAAGPPDAWLTAYWAGYIAMLERTDELPFEVRPVPKNFDALSPRFVVGPATATVEDGDRIELGGRTLVVRHVPGHTCDSICLIDESHGLLFGGDAIDSGAIYAHLPTADPERFASSLRALDESLPGSITTILSPHGEIGRESRDLIAQLATALEGALAGDGKIVAEEDCFQQPTHVALVGDFAISFPPTFREVDDDG